MKPKPFSYAFVACAFHATLCEETLSREGKVEEGSMELITLEQLMKESYCWGYDVIFEDYVREIVGETDFVCRKDDLRCSITRLSPDTIVSGNTTTSSSSGKWADGEKWQ